MKIAYDVIALWFNGTSQEQKSIKFNPEVDATS